MTVAYKWSRRDFIEGKKSKTLRAHKKSTKYAALVSKFKNDALSPKVI